MKPWTISGSWSHWKGYVLPYLQLLINLMRFTLSFTFHNSIAKLEILAYALPTFFPIATIGLLKKVLIKFSGAWILNKCNKLTSKWLIKLKYMPNILNICRYCDICIYIYIFFEWGICVLWVKPYLLIFFQNITDMLACPWY